MDVDIVFAAALTTIVLLFAAAALAMAAAVAALRAIVDELEFRGAGHKWPAAVRAAARVHLRVARTAVRRDRSRRAFWLAAGAALVGAVAALLVFMLASVSRVAPPLAASRPAVLAAWVQLLPADAACDRPLKFAQRTEIKPVPACGVAFSFRAVVAAGSPCPPVEMGAGRPARASKQRQKLVADNFSEIDVCEATIGAAQAPYVSGFAGLRAPLPDAWRNGVESLGVVALGDTGCRDNDEQSCRTQWPFRTVAEAAARQASKDSTRRTVIVHLGDYLYVKPDDWKSWSSYFFQPAKPLLEAAPWVMVRGNHENCSPYAHGTSGFSLFFGHGPAMSCAAADEMQRSYALDLSPALRLVVLDNSISYQSSKDPKVVDAGASAVEWAKRVDRRNADRLEEALGHAFELSAVDSPREAWVAMHVPAFAIDVGKNAATGKVDELIPLSSVMMLAAWQVARAEYHALRKSDTAASPPMSALLSADRHLFQAVTAHGGHPQQITVGSGGVNLDALPYAASAPEATFPDPHVVRGRPLGWSGCSYKGHGFLLAEPGASAPMRFVPVPVPLAPAASGICGY